MLGGGGSDLEFSCPYGQHVDLPCKAVPPEFMWAACSFSTDKPQTSELGTSTGLKHAMP